MSANQYTEEDERENQFSNEDIVEVIEQDDELDRPLDDEGDDEYDGPTGFVPDDGQGPYHGEIIIGGPGPGEEDEDMDMDGEGGEAPREDNSWGHAGTYLHIYLFVRVKPDGQSCTQMSNQCSRSPSTPSSPLPLWPSPAAKTTSATTSAPSHQDRNLQKVSQL